MANQTQTAKHTPGPWENLHKAGVATKIDLTGRWKVNIGKRVTEMSGKMIATIFGHTQEEAEANASLIAAAPELLDALQEAVFHLQGYLVQYGHAPTMQKKMDGFKSLITKATGGNTL